MLDGYRGKIQEGDIVRLPCGTEATVEKWFFDCGGNAMVAWVKPRANFVKRFWMALREKTTFADEQIDELVLVTPAATES